MGRRSPVEHREAVSRLLRQIRGEAGLTQNDVALKLRQPQSYVSKYESAARRVDVLELRDILRVLGFDLKSFVDRLEAELKRVGPGTPPPTW